MKTQFDKIYVISLITNKDRQEFVKHQFNELGLEFEFIYALDFYKIKIDRFGRTIKYPKTTVWEALDNDKLYSSTLAHYEAVLKAYEFGYNNVLIVEDDICFIKDKEILEYYLNNIPETADFVVYPIRFHLYDEMTKFSKYVEQLEDKETQRFIKLSNDYKSLCGAMMYGLMNRKAIELYLNNQRKLFSCNDHVMGFFENPTINRYIALHGICIDQLYKLKKNKHHIWGYKQLNIIGDCDNYYEPESYHISDLCPILNKPSII